MKWHASSSFSLWAATCILVVGIQFISYGSAHSAYVHDVQWLQFPLSDKAKIMGMLIIQSSVLMHSNSLVKPPAFGMAAKVYQIISRHFALQVCL